MAKQSKQAKRREKQEHQNEERGRNGNRDSNGTANSNDNKPSANKNSTQTRTLSYANVVQSKRPNGNGQNNNVAATSVVSDVTAPSSSVQKRHVLAQSYIPQKLRELNLLPVKGVLNAERPIQQTTIAACQHLYGLACVPPPACTCRSQAVQRAHIFPWTLVPQLSRELRFALHHTSIPKTQENSNEASIENRADYINKFRKLLRLEHESTLILYERYSQYQVKPLFFKKGGTNNTEYYAKIYIPGIYDARPPVVPGDTVLLRTQHRPLHPSYNPTDKLDRVEIQANVIQTIRNPKHGDEVVISWFSQPAPALEDPRLTYTIRFIPSTVPVERNLAALNWLNLIDEDVAREMLFPTKAPQLPAPPPGAFVQDPSLNTQQSDFVQMALARTRHPSTAQVRPPLLLTGPAGTGKTKALLVAILQILNISKEGGETTTSNTTRQPRILVCTPSHTAADVITRRLVNQGGFERTQLFRLYDSRRSVATVPVGLLPWTRQKQNGDFVLPPVSELLNFQIIVSTCSDAHLLFLSGLTNSQLRIRRDCLWQHCQKMMNKSGIEVTRTDASAPHFTHLFVDEAAQATEPELLIPLSVVVDDGASDETTEIPKVEIVLAGDPRQLSPDVYSPASRSQLQISMLERLLRLPEGGGRQHLLGPPTEDTWRTVDELLEYSFHHQRRDTKRPYLSVFLSQSYRGHPSFLHMPSKLFYFDKLQSALVPKEEDADMWLSRLKHVQDESTRAYNQSCNMPMPWPIHFRGVRNGQDCSLSIDTTSTGGANSWSNAAETSVVSEIVMKLVENGVSTQSIGIMAAFRAQVMAIRKKLREVSLGAVNVGIVEDYQAVEREVIIVSLTRSSPEFQEADVAEGMGLFQQPKRINVCLTRAECLLIVVGNPVIMDQDPIWKEWLAYCREHGLWYGASIEED